MVAIQPSERTPNIVPWISWGLVALTVAFASDVAIAQGARGIPGLPSYATKAPPPPPPPSGGKWLSVRVGAPVEVSITLGLAGFAETLSEFELQTAGIEGTPAPSFALGLHHRFRRLDLGVGVEHRPGQPVLLEHARKSPGQLIGNLHLGWRMFEGHRGALYSRVALGGFFAMPDDGFRASVAHHFTDVPDFEAVDERFAGISTSAHFGGVLYYGDGLGFFVEMANYLSFGLLHLDNTEMTYEANEVALNAGATWSL